MSRHSLYILFVLVIFFTSCRVKKEVSVSKKTEKRELKELRVKKDLK